MRLAVNLPEGWGWRLEDDQLWLEDEDALGIGNVVLGFHEENHRPSYTIEVFRTGEKGRYAGLALAKAKLVEMCIAEEKKAAGSAPLWETSGLVHYLPNPGKNLADVGRIFPVYEKRSGCDFITLRSTAYDKTGKVLLSTSCSNVAYAKEVIEDELRKKGLL